MPWGNTAHTQSNAPNDAVAAGGHQLPCRQPGGVPNAGGVLQCGGAGPRGHIPHLGGAVLAAGDQGTAVLGRADGVHQGGVTHKLHIRGRGIPANPQAGGAVVTGGDPATRQGVHHPEAPHRVAVQPLRRADAAPLPVGERIEGGPTPRVPRRRHKPPGGQRAQRQHRRAAGQDLGEGGRRSGVVLVAGQECDSHLCAGAVPPHAYFPAVVTADHVTGSRDAEGGDLGS